MPNGDADFARTVLEYYRAALREEGPDDTPERDARSVAIGLATITSLLRRERAALKSSLDAPATGLVMALEIVDALTTGRGHPIWRHISGVQSAFRMGRMRPTGPELMLRWIVVGFVRAYQQTASVSQSEALRRVSDVCRYEHDGDVFTIEQVRGWDRRFIDEADPGPDAAAAFLIEKATELNRPWPLPERLLKVGQAKVHILAAVPVLGERPPRTPK